MKKITFLLFMSVFLAGNSSNAETISLLGRWINTDQATSGITQLEITQTSQDIYIQAWGKCHPNDCDWGKVRAKNYGKDIQAKTPDNATALLANFRDQGGGTTIALILGSGDLIYANTYRDFRANDKRTNYANQYTFSKASAYHLLKVPSANINRPGKTNRIILPNGCVEIKNPEGGSKMFGCDEAVNTGGTGQKILKMTAMPPTPPEENSPTNSWLQRHNQYLYDIMAKGYGEESMENYRAWEEGHLSNIFDKISKRVELINDLLINPEDLP